jgi:hypothetical protein
MLAGLLVPTSKIAAPTTGTMIGVVTTATMIDAMTTTTATTTIVIGIDRTL